MTGAVTIRRWSRSHVPHRPYICMPAMQIFVKTPVSGLATPGQANAPACWCVGAAWIRRRPDNRGVFTNICIAGMQIFVKGGGCRGLRRKIGKKLSLLWKKFGDTSGVQPDKGKMKIAWGQSRTRGLVDGVN